MKRTFTLLSLCLTLMGGYAQTDGVNVPELDIDDYEHWFVNTDDGKLKSDYVANSDANAMSVVKFSTTNVTGTHTSGPVAGYNDGELVDGKLSPKVDNTWGGLQTKALSKNGSVGNFYYVSGKGNPVNLDKVEFEEIITAGEGTGNYRAKWDDSYYSPDGSNGLPTNGTYVTLSSKKEGLLVVAAWINKGNRDIYVVKASDKKALAFGTDVAVSGFINGQNNDVAEDSPLYGYPKYQDKITTKRTEGTDAYILGGGNQAVWAYLGFKAEANETYYIFAKSTQIGFGGFILMTSDPSGISDVTVADKALKSVRYNISGQQVDASYKGLVIENGKKFVQK